jgi:hypothetical protein
MRWFVLAALTVLLSGCGLPTAVTVVSLMANGVSYVSTGKSVTDHGISAALQKDCALLRGFEGDICLEPDPAEAFAESLAFATDPAVTPRPAGQAPVMIIEEVRFLGDTADPPS